MGHNQPYLIDYRFRLFREKMNALRAEAKTSRKRKRGLSALLPGLWREAAEIHDERTE